MPSTAVASLVCAPAVDVFVATWMNVLNQIITTALSPYISCKRYDSL